MTTFHDDVLDALLDLGPDDVVTYAWIAHAAGHPGSARAVGNLLRNTPDAPNWWRVVAADGRLVAPAADEQARRLRAAGFPVEDGRLAVAPRGPR